MATRTLPTGLVLRPIRVFKNHYQCDACPNEWADEMLTQGASFCPCCDREVEPYYVEAFTEDRVEFDLSEAA